jgi:uncharacterized protein (TIGR02145 family)
LPTITNNNSSVKCSDIDVTFDLTELAYSNADLQFSENLSFTPLIISQTVTLSPGTSKTVYVRAHNSNTGCYSASNTINLKLLQSPTVDINTPAFSTFTCLNKDDQLTLSIASTCEGTCSYTWNTTPETVGASLTLTADKVAYTPGTTFTVTVREMEGPNVAACRATDNVTISRDFYLPGLQFSMPTTYCLDGTGTLPTVANNGVAGTWSPSTIDFSTVGTSTYTFSSTGYCNVEVDITIEECEEALIDCDLFTNKEVNEDYIGACEYTHKNTNWDIDPVTMADLDVAKYFINGIVYDVGPSASLYDAIFSKGNNTVMVVAYKGSFTDTCYFNVKVDILCPSTSDPDGDGNDYDVVKINGLCWTMNLKTRTYAPGAPVSGDIAWAKPYKSDLYNNEVDNEDIFGLLYTWYSAVGLVEGDDVTLPVADANGNVQGICPDGWHIPAVVEWNMLGDVHNSADLKSILYWPQPGTNASGFNAPPAGWCNAAIDKFVDLYGRTYWWAADDTPNQFAHVFYLSYYCDFILEETKNKADGLSVRCVKNDVCD